MKSILITGGSGFFGQGFVRHLLAHCPEVERICIFSRGEYTQALMRQNIADPDGRLRWFIGDVRDKDRLTKAMRGVDDVVHAAALKRVEVGEQNPSEMMKTNVIGAMNVIAAANDAGVARVVALSTDKACAPANAYGASKLAMEKLILGANAERGSSGPRFMVTRYGNVAGSTGSVIPTWRQTAERWLPGGGRPRVNVTSLMAGRFWMTLDQAVRLVCWTLDTMEGGEMVVPELPAYRLQDLADAMELATLEVGLGHGEKMYESMITETEAIDFGVCQIDPAGTGGIGVYWISGPGYPNEKVPHMKRISTRMMTVDELRESLKEVK